jgi:DNA-binding CsgD family transcriptional regulator
VLDFGLRGFGMESLRPPARFLPARFPPACASCDVASTLAAIANLCESARPRVDPRAPEVAALLGRIAAASRQAMGRMGSRSPGPCMLTAHESRLLELLVDGHSYRTMADVCGVSLNTVAFHMKRIYQKLDVHSKSQAVARAIRGGLVRSVQT